ncbi:hypothetical protein DP144_01935 [Clostridium tetani]|uniref:hypothetical protein n=1 Tax=Clostridium tetani TaxID=1513 RepID=UPI00100B0664|nr:hypothetical protein [Clostridium tetani]RXM79591.1 hypothetical protein DP154_01930 [Clostridium tetani]RYV00405.1 hypothetical protein DP144_01935 [Clostridium tetani]
MKIENIIKAQQPDIHKRLKQQNNKKKSRRGKQEHLSFSDVLELMKHDSYKRHRGAIRQR